MTAKQRRQHNKAREQVARALAHGRLTKPLLCENCGEQRSLQGHHEKGYAPRFWLWVRWLCIACHAAAEPRGYEQEEAGTQLDLLSSLKRPQESDAVRADIEHHIATRAECDNIHPHGYMRMVHRLTQKQIAEDLGISPVWLSLIYGGKVIPSRSLMYRMAQQFHPAFRLTVDELAAWHLRKAKGVGVKGFRLPLA